MDEIHIGLTWQYLDLADYLLIAEANTGLRAEILAEMPRVNWSRLLPMRLM